MACVSCVNETHILRGGGAAAPAASSVLFHYYPPHTLKGTIKATEQLIKARL